MLKWSTVDNSAYIVNHFKNPSGGRLQLSYMADGFSILVEWSFVSLCHHSQKLMWRQTYWSSVCLCFILQWWSIGNCFEYFKAQGASKKVSTWVLEGKTSPRGVGQRLKGWKLGRGGATILINTMPALWDKNNGFARGCYIVLSFIFHNRVVDVVDSLKARLTDPCITCHWSSVGSDTTTLATIHITSPEVGHLARLVCKLLEAISVELSSG